MNIEFYYDNEEVFADISANKKDRILQILLSGGVVKEQPHRGYKYELNNIIDFSHDSDDISLKLSLDERFVLVDKMYELIRQGFREVSNSDDILFFVKNHLTIKEKKEFKDNVYEILLNNYKLLNNIE